MTVTLPDLEIGNGACRVLRDLLGEAGHCPESQNLYCELENDSFVLAEGGTISYALVFHKEGPIYI